MRTRISQRDARRLKARVELLERILKGQRMAWSQEYFGGTEVARVTWDNKNDIAPLAVRTARKLGHAVVAVGDDSGCIRFVALPHPSEPIV